MSHLEDHGHDVVGGGRVAGARGASRFGAGGPVLALVVGKGGIDEFEREAAPVVRSLPDPPLVAEVHGTAGPDRPVTFVGIPHPVGPGAGGIGEHDRLTGIPQAARPGTEDVRAIVHAGVGGVEGGHIGHYQEVSAGRNRGSGRKGVGDPVGQAPAGDVDRGTGRIMKLDPLGPRVFGVRSVVFVVKDLVNDRAGTASGSEHREDGEPEGWTEGSSLHRGAWGGEVRQNVHTPGPEGSNLGELQPPRKGLSSERWPPEKPVGRPTVA